MPQSRSCCGGSCCASCVGRLTLSWRRDGSAAWLRSPRVRRKLIARRPGAEVLRGGGCKQVTVRGETAKTSSIYGSLATLERSSRSPVSGVPCLAPLAAPLPPRGTATGPPAHAHAALSPLSVIYLYTHPTPCEPAAPTATFASWRLPIILSWSTPTGLPTYSYLLRVLYVSRFLRRRVSDARGVVGRRRGSW